VNELLYNFNKDVEGIDFVKEGNGVTVVLIQEVPWQNVNKQLINVKGFEHVAIREGAKILTDRFFFLEKDPFKKNVPVIVGI